MSSEPEIGRASFLPAILPHMFWFSIAVASWFFGDALDFWEPVRNGFHAFSFAFGLLLGITLLFDFVAQYDLQTVHLNRQAALIEQIKKPEPPKPIESENKIDFPPLSFIDVIFSWRELKGDFPTVQELKNETRPTFQHKMIVLWWAQLIKLGAVVNRVEGGYSGDPNIEQGWTRDKFREMATKANTLTQVKV